MSYKNLLAWQKGLEVAKCTYDLTKSFPKQEMYGLVSQMQRSAVSIAANIAEGYRRGSKKEFIYFLRVAYGSGAELETYIELIKSLTFGQKLEYVKLETALLETMKMLNSLIAQTKSAIYGLRSTR